LQNPKDFAHEPTCGSTGSFTFLLASTFYLGIFYLLPYLFEYGLGVYMITINPKKSLRIEVFLYLLLGSFIPALIILLISAKQLQENLHTALMSKTKGGREVAYADLNSLVNGFKSSITALSKEEF